MFSGDSAPVSKPGAKGKGGKFWALRDVSFTVQPGEAVGLVGGNGQGKSTLLKLIAGVLLPDEGGVAVHGGVAPLIEVTGGFMGDLTARDNIWLTAGLHGLMHFYAAHLAREGVTANAIAPALIETEMVTSNLKATPGIIPVGRFGNVDEVASVVRLLAENAYLTGQTINVNGGWYPS